MNPPPAVDQPAHNHFVTTRWTRVLAARGNSEAARIALSELCSSYYGPVVGFLERTGCGGEDARDVAHEFFAGLLARDGLGDADKARGRFRSYLLGALKHFVGNRRAKALREKRGGQVEHQPIDPCSDSDPACGVSAVSMDTDRVFDREWAVSVVERALALLEQESVASGTLTQFATLKPWLSYDAEPGSQTEAARALGMNEGALKVAIHRLRRRFRGHVRAEVAQTVPEGSDVDAELRHLVEALAGVQGQG